MRFSNIFIVMTNVGNMTLQEALTSASFTQDHIVTIMYNILCSTKYLHSANVYHGDLTANKIQINSKCNICITDFTHSRTLPIPIEEEEVDLHIPEFDKIKSQTPVRPDSPFSNCSTDVETPMANAKLIGFNLKQVQFNSNDEV